MFIRLCTSTFLSFAAAAALAQEGPVTMSSPNGALRISFSVGGDAQKGGPLGYEVSLGGKPVMLRSRLGMEIQNQRPLGDSVRIAAARPSQGDETYTVPVGKSNPVRNRYNAVTIELAETGRLARRLNIEARAYDDAVAFRYVVPEQPAIQELRLVQESTQFQFAKDSTAYPLFLAGYRTSYEDNYHILPLSGIRPDWLMALPLLAEVPGTAWVAVTEAHIERYAGMYLVRSASNPRTLETRLAPRVDDPTLTVSGQSPVNSAWRVLMVAADPGRLIESTVVLSLNPPCAIADTSWIKPGKVAWDWWSGQAARNADFQTGMNTATMKHYIDFASASGFEYMLVDAGWAAHGTGQNDSGADLSATVPAIDMSEILRHAAAKKVRIWLWAHWSDIRQQMDEAFPLFEKWGVAGVKIDFMDRDDQWMVDFYRRVVKKAAEHRLMIDFHGAYKPDGLRRTYPNLITREGVMGLEYTKWSSRITPDHNVMLAFTRMLAGPMDYTPGGFDNVTREQFEARNRMPQVMGTRAHQLALFVVFESPLQMVSDYPGAYEGQRAFEFIRTVPSSWDETRVLHSRVPDTVTIARHRGQEWFVGSITNWRPQELSIPLDFLGKGEFLATVYADAPDAATNPRNTAIEERKIDSSTRLLMRLAPGGGQAVRIRPAP